MYYVYCQYVKTGKTECVNRTFDSPHDAIKHIAKCYDIDRELNQLGEYYYFMRHR